MLPQVSMSDPAHRGQKRHWEPCDASGGVLGFEANKKVKFPAANVTMANAAANPDRLRDTLAPSMPGSPDLGPSCPKPVAACAHNHRETQDDTVTNGVLQIPA